MYHIHTCLDYVTKNIKVGLKTNLGNNLGYIFPSPPSTRSILYRHSFPFFEYFVSLSSLFLNKYIETKMSIHPTCNPEECCLRKSICIQMNIIILQLRKSINIASKREVEKNCTLFTWLAYFTVNAVFLNTSCATSCFNNYFSCTSF